MKRTFTLGMVLALSASAGTKSECIRSSDQGQVLRDRAQLIEAQAEFRACADETCPALLRAECARWLAGVERRIPTVILRVRDHQGQDLTDVRVQLDARPWMEHLDGRLLAINPGRHTLRFEARGHVPTEMQVLIREAELERVLDMTFEPPALLADTSRMPTAPSSHVGPLVLGGAGLLGLGTFAIFGRLAVDELATLRSTCAPYCRQADVDSVQLKATTANIMLAVGVTALVTAALWYFLGRPPPAEPPPGSLSGAHGVTSTVMLSK
jgi:hypothetical protein